jgi:hypothetical protein
MNFETMFLPSLIMGVIGIIAYVLKNSYDKLNHTLTAEQIRMLIQDRLEPIIAQQVDLKEDFKALGAKIDMLVELLIKQNNKSDN